VYVSALLFDCNALRSHGLFKKTGRIVDIMLHRSGPERFRTIQEIVRTTSLRLRRKSVSHNICKGLLNCRNAIARDDVLTIRKYKLGPPPPSQQTCSVRGY